MQNKASPPKQDSVVQAQPGPDKYPKSDKSNDPNNNAEIKGSNLRAVSRVLSQWKKVRRNHPRASIRIPSQ